MTDTTTETAQAQGAESTETSGSTQTAVTAETSAPAEKKTTQRRASAAKKTEKAEGTETEGADGKAAGLAGLKLAQLQALAQQLGITGSSRMRKSALVEAISAHQRGGAVADREERAKKDSAKDSSKDSPKDSAKGSKGPKGSDQAEKPAEQDADSGRDDRADTGDKDRDRSSEKSQGKDQGRDQDARQDNRQGGGESSKQDQQRGRGRRGRGEDQPQRGEQREGQKGDQRGGQKDGQRSGQKGQNEGRGGRDGGRDSRDGGRDSRDGGRDSRDSRDGGRDGNRDGGRDGNRDGGRDGEGGRRNRRNRNRNERGNRRRGRNDPEVDDTEFTEDDVLVPVAGILDVLDNYAFIRTSGYLPGQNDVYVSLAQVKRYTLRKGDAVHGHIRAPREGENQNKRQKFNALVKLESVNGRPAESNTDRVDFSKLVPLYPQERLRLEGDPKKVSPRVIDLLAPIGKGQRGLIVSPPKAGKTMILQALAQSIKINNPEVHLMMVLVDERPEEVTDMQRTVDGEVIASTFDRPADDHTTVAELAIERAKRLVELGKDVVVLLDSMTRLGRAYNTAAPASGRILSGGVDANALYPPKRFFGAARNIENGGSLTILATALVETGSKMDEVIFEEFKGTGNMELRLSRHLADRRIFPAVDVNASSTRREENLLSGEEIKIMWKLRRVLSGLEQQQGLELLINKLKETSSNAEFLMLASKTALGDKNKKD
ncbi:transcription termination factor Rho [Nesterenkonia xinjiangensis]|uniref:Transcription termination factor Rho n=1 Tax=Nesterenkonia xinjiangensis TaxID=225327 RepID=A0A7Z0K8Y5_9MICC|nr:transcription termination factor Rho [Nesterenkonia xinjiangensis]